MRLYGKRFVKRYLEKRERKTFETRDAILWDILDDDRVCRVKVQGSDELVVAHYPRNWSKIPHWLKVGNAVRIVHRGGVRGMIEVVSDGRAVPTAVVGGTARPSPSLGGDVVLSGCQVSEASPTDMAVSVGSGYYRISNTVYALGGVSGSGIVMNDPAVMTMGGSIEMGQAVGFVEISAAPTTVGHFRYDIIVVGTDGTIDVVEGTEAEEPSLPSTPADHVRLGWVLLYYGMTEITDEDVNKTWTARAPVAIEITYSPSQDQQWTPPVYSPPTIDVQVYMVDQYGDYYDAPSIMYATLTKLAGDGDFCASPVSDACEVTTYGTYFRWTWTRPCTKTNGTYTDDATSSPIFSLSIEDGPAGSGSLRLYDESGTYLI